RVPPEVIDPGAFWHLGASLALHPDGTRLASTQGTVLQVWDAQSAQVLLESEEKTVLQSLAYAPDGRLIAGGCGDATIRLWDAATGKIQKTLADEDQLTPVTALAFALDSKTLASAGATGMEVWLWNVDSGEPCLLIPDALGGCAIESLAFHPQGRLLASLGRRRSHGLLVGRRQRRAPGDHHPEHPDQGIGVLSRRPLSLHRQRQHDLLSA